jgi:hypothetical protein
MALVAESTAIAILVRKKPVREKAWRRERDKTMLIPPRKKHLLLLSLAGAHSRC